MKREKTFSFRLSHQLRNALAEASQAERRSVANLVEKILCEWLEESDYLQSAATTDRMIAQRRQGWGTP
jgi:hypothetical protein